MNVVDQFLTLVLEDLNSNMVALVKSKEPNLQDDQVRKLLDDIGAIDKKKGNDSKKLLDFYYQSGKNLELLKEEYDNYLNLLKKSLLKKDINAFANFLEWTEYTHDVQGSLKKKTKYDVPAEKSNDKLTQFQRNFGDIPLVYSTSYIKIYHVRSVNDAIILGKGVS